MIKRIILCILIINPNIILAAEEEETNDTLNVDFRFYRSMDDYDGDTSCTIDTKSNTFNLTLTDIPVGETSGLIVSESDCSSEEGIGCADMSFPQFTIICEQSASVTITASESKYDVLDTTNTHTLTVDKITPNETSVSIASNSSFDLSIGALFSFPDTLEAGTTYTWNSTDGLTDAITIDFQ